jgi:hypothetical protein
MRRWGMRMFACLALVLAGMAFAKEPATTLQVVGDLYLGEDGSVQRVTVDESTPLALKQLVQSTAASWRFEPVLRDGVAARVRTGMVLDLEGIPVEGGLKSLRVTKVTFNGARTKYANLVVPRLYEGMQVLTALRVDAAGNVTDVAVLYLGMGGANVNTMMRREMTEALVRSLKRSRIRPADLAYGDPADETMLLPIDYTTASGRASSDSQRRFREMKPVPWLDAAHQPSMPRVTGLAPGSAVAIDEDDVKLRSSVIGTLL